MSLLLAALVQGALGCEPPDPSLVATVPSDGAVDVPLDGRLVLRFDGVGDWSKFSWALQSDDGAVDLSADAWTHAGNDSSEASTWVALVPDGDLLPETSYTLTVSDPAGGDWTTAFATGVDTVQESSTSPALELAAVLELETGDTGDCGPFPRRTVALSVDVDDARILDLAQIYRIDPDGDEEPSLLRTVSVAGLGSGVVMSLAEGDLERMCFSAVQTDAAGGVSGSSDVVCWDVAEDDTGFLGDDTGGNTPWDGTGTMTGGSRNLDPYGGGGCTGCASVSAGGVGVAALWGLGLMGLVLRRRD